MKHKGWLILGGILAFAIAAGFWWDVGQGQTWLAIHTGTDYCVNIPAHALPVCKAYGFFSGIGSDFGEYVIFTALGGTLIVTWRAHTCQAKWWCWRRQNHALADHPDIKLCHVHHPDTNAMSVTQAIEHHRRNRG